MKIEKCLKPSFEVIGKEGSTSDGAGFIPQLWKEANAHFDEIVHLAKRDEHGNLCGLWGAMSDKHHLFQPWENNFSEGLYLAGVECIKDSIVPEGWSKWIIPSYEYLYVACEEGYPFQEMIEYMKDNHIELVAAAHDFTCPATQKSYIFFPIKKVGV